MSLSPKAPALIADNPGKEEPINKLILLRTITDSLLNTFQGELIIREGIEMLDDAFD
jgi:hypothetical protein